MLSRMLRTDEIRRRRQALGLTMAEAAKLAGLSSLQQWWNIENGFQPDLRSSTLSAVAYALGCKMDDLFTRDAPDKPKPRRKPRQK